MHPLFCSEALLSGRSLPQVCTGEFVEHCRVLFRPAASEQILGTRVEQRDGV